MRLGCLFLLALLAACGGEKAGYLPPEQVWNGWHVRIETRPLVMHAGMNEFLVIISDARGLRPKEDFLVTIRSRHSQWIQAIPDGGVGVYRRALGVKDHAHARLYVRLREESGAKRQGEMTFDFTPPAGWKPEGE